MTALKTTTPRPKMPALSNYENFRDMLENHLQQAKGLGNAVVLLLCNDSPVASALHKDIYGRVLKAQQFRNGQYGPVPAIIPADELAQLLTKHAGEENARAVHMCAGSLENQYGVWVFNLRSDKVEMCIMPFDSGLAWLQMSTTLTPTSSCTRPATQRSSRSRECRTYEEWSPKLLLAQLNSSDTEGQITAAWSLANLGRFAGCEASNKLNESFLNAADDKLAEAVLAASNQINESNGPERDSWMRRGRCERQFIKKVQEACESIETARTQLWTLLDGLTGDPVLDDGFTSNASIRVKAVEEIVRRHPRLFSILYHAFKLQPDVKSGLVELIAGLVPDYPPALQAIIYALGEEDPDLREAAVCAFSRCRRHAASAIPKLLDMVQGFGCSDFAFRILSYCAQDFPTLGPVIFKRLPGASLQAARNLTRLLRAWAKWHPGEAAVVFGIEEYSDSARVRNAVEAARQPEDEGVV